MSLLKSIKQYMKTGNIKENYTTTIPIKDDNISVELKDVDKAYKAYIKIDEENNKRNKIINKYFDISWLSVIAAFILLGISLITMLLVQNYIIRCIAGVGIIIVFIMFVLYFVFAFKAENVECIKTFNINSLTKLLKLINIIDTNEKIGFKIEDTYGDFGAFKYFNKNNKEFTKTYIPFDKVHYCLNSPNKILGWFDEENYKYMIEYYTTYNEEF